MEDFTYHSPTKIIFGKNSEKSVGKEIKKFSTNILFHYGQGSIKKYGLHERIINSLNEEGINYTELPGVVPNPKLSLVVEGIEICREKKIDFILAVGGGSVIDSAKAIAAGIQYKGHVWDFWSKQIPVEKAFPIGVVLTIPAAGSETSPNTVITNDDEVRKLGMGYNTLRPRFAIMNPELTYTLPAFQTASGIADMFAHIVERYFSNTEYADLTDKMCEATIRSIIKNGPLVLKNPQNYDYRAEIMLCSTIAHNGILGIGRIEDWSSHKIEHELSAYYDVTHGAGLSVIIPAWMKFVYKHDVKRFIQYANEVWGIEGNDEKTALNGIEATEKFFKSLDLPVTLKELNINEEKLEEMSKKAVPNDHIGSFVKLKPEDVLQIYKLALK